jgi:hypothetical protein
MITIAGSPLKTSKPKDLDEQLVASTGCSSREIATILAAGPDRAARALRPFLEPDTLPGGELGSAIASDPNAVSEIGKLYAGLAATSPSLPAPGGEKE